MKIIFLILIGCSLLYSEITRNKNTYLVKDTDTQLEWQDNEISKKMSWNAAVKHCKNLSYRGHGWRLPSKEELFTIVDRDNAYPAINSEFRKTGLSYYWTSTPFIGNKNAFWGIGFAGGTQFYGYDSYKSHARCVRDLKR